MTLKTELNRPRIIVVGSGPSAAAFCKRAEVNGIRVTVLSEGDLEHQKITKKYNKVNNVTQIWKLQDYNVTLEFSHQSYSNFDYYSAHDVGGLTTRWGGGVAKLSLAILQQHL